MMACEFCEPVEASFGFAKCKPIKSDWESKVYLRKICLTEAEWWEIVAAYRISQDVTSVVTSAVNHCPMCGCDLRLR